MSAFMVSHKCMSQVMYGIELARGKTKAGGWSFVEPPPAPLDPYNRKTMGKALFAMNARAIMVRYGEDESKHGARFSYKGEACSVVQAIKSLHCLHYQCSEGGVPDEPLYKWIEKVTAALEGHYVQTSKEYNEATWG